MDEKIKFLTIAVIMGCPVVQQTEDYARLLLIVTEAGI